jgi:4-amino-4-deoxy-L-arabinose transferase-like glycosyltransferase
MSEISQRPRAQAATTSMLALIGQLALVAFALAALVLLWRAAVRLAALLAYAYPHDGLEGTLLYESRLLWSGEPLYQPLEPQRFVAAPYPPVHPLLLGLFDQIPGAHVFWGGRLLSLVAALGVAVLIVLLVRRVAGSWLAGLLGAALFLSAPPALLWATRIKPDMLALLWTTLGLYLATDDRRPTTDDRASLNEQRTKNKEQKAVASSPLHPLTRSPLHLVTLSSCHLIREGWSLLAAAICFALAFFTKQTAVAAPLAVGLALLVADVRAFRAGARAGYASRLPIRRRTLTFGLTYLGLLAATWLLLDFATRGQFSFHVWEMHRRASWSAALMWKFVALLAPYWPAMLLAVALLAVALPARGVRRDRALVPAGYALLAPLTLLGAGKTGANHNHLLETLLALALAAGIAAGWTARARPGANGQIMEDRGSSILHPPSSILYPLSAVVIIALLAVQLALAFRPQAWYIGELAPVDPPERFLIFIRNTPGEILADNVGLLLMAGKPLRYDDPTGMGPVALSGLWDQRGLIDDIQQQRFSAIILPLDIRHDKMDPAGHWTPEVIAAVDEHYHIAFHDRINTYIPK